LIGDYQIAERYLQRLRETLKFRLWVVEDTPELGKPSSTSRCSRDDGRYKDTPGVARTCFTELKLSDARRHAYQYGRLGFGVKRTYLFRRGGRPMIYVGPQRTDVPGNWNPSYPDWITGQRPGGATALTPDDVAWTFVKYMSETEDLSFTYYSESEWRIICPDRFSKALKIALESTEPEKFKKFAEFERLV